MNSSKFSLLVRAGRSFAERVRAFGIHSNAWTTRAFERIAAIRVSMEDAMKDVYKKPGDRWLEETVKYLDKLTEVLLRAYRKWEEEQEREKK